MPTSASDKEFLRQFGWLGTTPVTFQDAVLARGYLATFPAGKTVYDIGDPPAAMFGVVSGHALITTVSAQGVSKLSHAVRPGEWFGVASMLVREPRRVRVSAPVMLQIFMLPFREIDTILGDPITFSDAWRQFARLVVANSDVAVGVARDLMIRDSTIRCLAVVLRLTGYRHNLSAAEEQPEVALAQEDLAYLANLSRNAAGTVLRGLEKDGVIEIAYRRLKLLRPREIVDRVNRYERENL